MNNKMVYTCRDLGVTTGETERKQNKNRIETRKHANDCKTEPKSVAKQNVCKTKPGQTVPCSLFDTETLTFVVRS